MFSSAKEPPKDISSGPGLILQVGTSRYRVMGSAGSEVAPCPALASVPRAPHWLLGIGLYKGDAIPVIALQALLDADSPQTKTQAMAAARMLVVRDVGRAMAYLVDDVDADRGAHQGRDDTQGHAPSQVEDSSVVDLDLLAVSRVLMTQSLLVTKLQ